MIKERQTKHRKTRLSTAAVQHNGQLESEYRRSGIAGGRHSRRTTKRRREIKGKIEKADKKYILLLLEVIR